MQRREDIMLTAARADAAAVLLIAERHARSVARSVRRWSVKSADWVLRHGDDVTTHDVRGVVFRPRYDWLTLVRAVLPVARDARGRPTVVATSRMHHLARHRRERLWGVRAAIEHDVRAVMRRTRRRTSLLLLLAAVCMYGVLAVLDGQNVAGSLVLPVAISAFALVVCAIATPLLQPSVPIRRRIVLSHARCACCMERVERDETDNVSRCTLCGCAWMSAEVGEADGEHHRCDGCAYDLSGVHEPHCPECGTATGRLRRAA